MKRKFETELANAPYIPDEMLRIIGDISCSGECHMQVCHQDRHHLIYNSQGDLTDAERLLKSHPDFILRQVCREKHEKIHRTWDRSEPISDEFVIGYLLASPVNMSNTRKKKLNNLRRIANV